MLRTHIEFKLSKLLVSSFLQRAELKDKLLIALGLIAEFSLELAYSALLLVFALGQVLNLPLI